VKVRVDARKCVGHGRCYVLAPDVFEDDERGHCLVRHEVIRPALAAQAKLGEENCPEDAISVED
jgi:ferredoxin